MTTPEIKYFGTGDRLYVQAQQVWLILVAFVMHADRTAARPPTITYGDLALKMGHSDRRAGHTLGRQLGIVGNFCVRNDLPALNAIVVGQDTGLPGAEVIVRRGFSPNQEQQAVMKIDWFELRVPTTGTFRRVWESSQP
jgi:hypothetical protein